MITKTLTKLMGILAGLGFMTAAHAYTITPNFNLIATGDHQSDPNVGTSTLLYKSNQGTGENGDSFDANYTTVYDNEPNDPADATITWDGGNFINNATHLFIKDGNQDPGWYLF